MGEGNCGCRCSPNPCPVHHSEEPLLGSHGGSPVTQQSWARRILAEWGPRSQIKDLESAAGACVVATINLPYLILTGTTVCSEVRSPWAQVSALHSVERDLG